MTDKEKARKEHNDRVMRQEKIKNVIPLPEAVKLTWKPVVVPPPPTNIFRISETKGNKV